MKIALISLLACAAGSFAAAVDPRTFPIGQPLILTQWQAEDIVNKFKSILEGVSYKGKTPLETTKEVVAENYIEYSDSIQSIISLNNTVSLSPEEVVQMLFNTSLIHWILARRRCGPFGSESR
jgi:hypothetical protein